MNQTDQQAISFHVGICDDDPAILKMLCAYFDKLSSETGITVSVASFSDGSAVLQQDLSKLDLLILDIQMKNTNGLETAREIRKVNQKLTIIFFTNYIQYALEGYEVQAYRFLLKPLSYEQFSDIVGNILNELRLRKKALLTVHSKTKICQIPIEDILYVETYKGHVLIHTASDTTESFIPMKEIEKELGEYHFLRCHTAFLVSLRAVRGITQQDVQLQNGQNIPLSKHRRKVVKEAVTLFWGEQFL